MTGHCLCQGLRVEKATSRDASKQSKGWITNHFGIHIMMDHHHHTTARLERLSKSDHFCKTAMETCRSSSKTAQTAVVRDPLSASKTSLTANLRRRATTICVKVADVAGSNTRRHHQEACSITSKTSSKVNSTAVHVRLSPVRSTL